MAFEVDQVVPVLRIFDVTKAREFYVDYLGLTVDRGSTATERLPATAEEFTARGGRAPNQPPPPGLPPST